MPRRTGCRPGALVVASTIIGLVATAAPVGATPAPVPGSAAAGTSSPATGTGTTRTPDPDPVVRVRPAKRGATPDAVDLPRPVRGATAVRLLGERADEAAALNGRTEAELVELLLTDDSAWLTTGGVVFFQDPVIAPTGPVVQPVASVPLDQTFTLHSKPGSQRTIFLDFDGAAASATLWHQQYPTVPTTQPAWDPSGNGAAFSTFELTSIQEVWQSVAEDYAPFDIDVTTADPGAAAINRSSDSDQLYGSHLLVTPSAGAWAAICNNQCGGVAFNPAWGGAYGAGGDGYGYRQPAWVFPDGVGNTAKGIAEAASHEVGHNLSLDHDGNASQGYDEGHGAWAPIMGVGYYHPLSQWSKGNYAGANNQQDDVAIIRDKSGLRTDEAGSSVATAAPMPAGTAYVASRTDVDTYLLGTCSGSVTVSANARASQANLDIGLTLLNASGGVIASNDPPSGQTSATVAFGLNASIPQTLTSATYYVAVDGVGAGDWSSGYDDYGSIGAYTMTRSGTCDGAAPTGVPSAPTSPAATPHASDATVAVTWGAPTSAGSSAVTGYVLTRSGQDVPVQVAAGTTSYTWTGLTASTAYSFTVTALNARGPGPTSTMSATTASGIVKPSVPQNVTGSWDSLGQAGLLAYSPPATSGSYPLIGYDIYADDVRLGTVTGTSVNITGLQPGTHTLGVAAVSQAGSSAQVSVTVVTPARPANDTFAQRTTLSGVSGTLTGNNLESSAETNEPAPPAVRELAGKASLWYSWTASASGPVTLSTGSTVAGRDTTLGVYLGTAVGSLSQVAGNDDANASSRLSTVQFNATANTTYAIAVNGYRGFAAGVGQFSLTWAGTEVGPKTTTTTLAVTVTGRSARLDSTVTASFGTPIGYVQFTDGNTVIGYGDVYYPSTPPTLTVTDLLRGDHAFQATFIPDNSANFTASQSPVRTVAIAATATTTTLQATADAQQVTLASTVTAAAGTVAGTVQFRDGTTPVGSATVSGGTASLVLPGVTPGAHSYTASFVPADDGRYAGSTSAAQPVTVAQPPVVEPTATTTGLTSQVSGRSATFTATVTAASGTATGTVQLRDGTTVVGTGTLSGGTVTLTVSDLTRGTHHFRALYLPADTAAFAGSESPDVPVEIAATPTATSLSTSVSGRTVTLQTSVSPAAAGTVELREGTSLVGTVTLVSGSGQLTLTDVPAGDHTYVATFVPADDLRFAASTSAARTATVVATPTSTSLGSSVSGHRVTLLATVTATAGSPAGVVELREGTTLLATVPLAQGTAGTVLDGVATGGHTYTATFVPADATRYAGSVSATHTATVAATPTTTDLLAVVSGRTVTLTATPATSSGDLAGHVELREGTTVLGTVVLSGGSAVLELSGVAPGQHGYTATFVPDGTYHAGSVSALRSVAVRVTSATSLTATATGRDVLLSATVATDGGAPEGLVELYDGTTRVATERLGAGEVSVTLPGVTPGSHVYVARFVPDSPTYYAGSDSPERTVSIDKVATATGLATAVDGRTVTLTATSNDAPGSVVFREGTTVLDTVPLSNGSAQLAVTAVAPGEHTYTATFVPTDSATYTGSVSPQRTVTVAKVATTTGLATAVDGRTVTLTATSNDAPGSVVFREGTTVLDTVVLSSGSAALELTGVTPGDHSYTATFVPTDTATYTGSVSPERTVTVAKVATTTGLATAVDGRTVTLTATSNDAPGSVVFREGTTVLDTVPLTSGSALLVLTDVAPGEHTYTATFVPTDTATYAGSVSPERTAAVDRLATSTGLAAAVDGQKVVLTASSSDAPGSVVFREGTTVLGTVPLTGGTAVLELTGVTPGEHGYTATFVPTDTSTYAGSVSPSRTVTVARLATSTGLAATVDAQTVTLTGSSSDAPGSVVFREGTTVLGTVPLTGGTAVLELTGVSPGEHGYTATFVPTDASTYAGSVSPSRTVTVDPIATSTSLAALVTDDTVVLQAGVDPGATGDVVFREGDTVLGTVGVQDSSAALTLQGVASGEHTYTATFVPASPATYAASVSSPRTVTVKAATTTSLSATADQRTVTLLAEVAGAGASGGEVVFREGSTVLGTVTLESGSASLSLTDVVPGEHGYRATFVPASAATVAGSVSDVRTVTVDPIVTTTGLDASVDGRLVTLTAQVAGASGTPTGAVELREGDSLLDTVDLQDGSATFELAGVTPGAHHYRATFVPADAVTFAGSTSTDRTVTVAPVATDTALVASVDGRTVTLDAAVTSGYGTPTGDVVFREGTEVVGTFVLGSGAATLELTTVAPGEHAYTATFVPADAVTHAGSVSPARPVTVAALGTDTHLATTVDVRTVILDATVAAESGMPEGEVVFREGDAVLGTVVLASGAASLELTGVDPGEHAYTATYVPADPVTFGASVSPERLVTVDPILTATDLATRVDVRTVTLDAAVTGDSATPAGEVVFREGDAVLGTVVLESGAASLELAGVDPGEHAYTATFVPANPGTFAGSASPERLATVDPILTATDLAAQVDVRTVTLDAAVTGDSGMPAGEVVFREGDAVLGTVVLESGAASLQLTGVDPGEHAYTATFVPAHPATFAGSASPERLVTVDPIVTTTELTPTSDARTVTLDVRVTGAGGGSPAGEVVLREGETVLGTLPLQSGAASLQLTGVDPGEHTYTATFAPGDPATYAASGSGDRSVTVRRVATTTDLTSAVDERTVTLTATVGTADGAPQGVIEFLEDGNPLATELVSEGTAVATLRGVAPGVHTYSAVFVPDGTMYAGSASQDHTLTVSSAAIVTTTSLQAVLDNHTVTFSAQVTSAEGAPEGMVELWDGDVLLETLFLTNGFVDHQVFNVTTGTHSYVARFVPDDDVTFAPSSSPAQSVEVAGTPTTTWLGTWADGSSVTLSAFVYTDTGNSTPTGTLELREGTRLIESYSVRGGVIEHVVTGVLGGQHTYTATFVPSDGIHDPSASEPSTVQVAPTATETGLQASLTGRTVTLAASVAAPLGVPAGNIQFEDAGVVLDTVVVKDGAASLAVDGVRAGSHDYVAIFVPTDQSRHSFSYSPTRSVTVAASTTTTSLGLTVTDSTVTAQVQVTSPYEVPDGVVVLREGDASVGSGVVDAGAGTVTLTDVPRGLHTYAVDFYSMDPDAYLDSTSAPQTVRVGAPDPEAVGTVTALDAVVTARSVALTAVVTAGDATPAGTVVFAEDGIDLGPPVEPTQGVYRLTRDLASVGEHTYTATFVPADAAAYASSVSAGEPVTVQPTATATTLTGSVSGTTVSLNALVSVAAGAVPEGQVQFFDGTRQVGLADVVDARATVLVTGAAVGAHSYHARFVPASGDYSASDSATVGLTVDRVASRTTITAPKRAKPGTRPVVKVKVLRGTAPAAGVVVLKYGTKSVSLTLRSGVASFKLPQLRAGTLKLTATYRGNSTTKPSVATWSIVVRR